MGTLVACAAVVAVAEERKKYKAVEERYELTPDLLKQWWKAMDTNKDSKVSKDEMEVFHNSIQAHSKKHNTEQNLQDLDKNHDDKLSLEEALAMYLGAKGVDYLSPEQRELTLARFKGADVDGNGHLDFDELHSFYNPEQNLVVMQAEIDALIKQRDENGDGKLSVKEYWKSMEHAMEEDEDIKGSMEGQIKQYDLDGDNLYNAEELFKFHMSSHDVRQFEIFDDDSQIMKTADKDEDGFITLEEWLNAEKDFEEGHAEIKFRDWKAYHREL